MSPCTADELAQVGLFGALPEERVEELGERMVREEVQPGATVVREGGEDDRFYVILDGVFAVSQSAAGARRVLHAGDHFGEVAPLIGDVRSATVHALTPAIVASCDRATFDEFVRPLFADR